MDKKGCFIIGGVAALLFIVVGVVGVLGVWFFWSSDPAYEPAAERPMPLEDSASESSSADEAVSVEDDQPN